MLKRILQARNYSEPVNVGLLLLRIVIAGFMLTHGGPKFLRLLGGDLSFGDPLGIGEELSFILVVFAEFFCSLLLLAGLFTRLAAVPLLITMFVALIIVHADEPLTDHYNIIGYITGYFILLITGGGKYSVDYRLWKERPGGWNS